MTQTQPLFLYQLPPALGLPFSESPPCAKVEIYLRLTHTPYEARIGDTRTSPNAMAPFVRWPDGRLQAESSEIIAHLEANSGLLSPTRSPLDQDLDPERLSRARALATLIEEVAYDACLHDRFVSPEGWRLQRPITRELVAHFIPAPLAAPAAEVIRLQQIRRAARGPMRHPSSGYRLACDAIDQVEALLGNDAYLTGERPSTADCSIWAHLIHTAATPNDSPTRRTLRRSRPLLDWLLRLASDAGWTVDPGILNGER
ncbi:glutathione S-transferase family protein [Lujinxingia vulgaris]|uniref:Glutathione S-transferase family protein n=1 Tax=Lujinxingia vulgaris TaxID=2600176 RepID=A0A5C6XML5_9DELT|nr:glutathione S-transferase family protein [Lujinxingia vulgaris]TXD41797.1 glutathione S-transferase family protein [Lujinxingia vulgaris]